MSEETITTTLRGRQETRTYHEWRNDTPYSHVEELFADYLVSRYIWGNRVGEAGATAMGCLRCEPFILRNHAGIPARLVR